MNRKTNHHKHIIPPGFILTHIITPDILLTTLQVETALDKFRLALKFKHLSCPSDVYNCCRLTMHTHTLHREICQIPVGCSYSVVGQKDAVTVL